MKNCSSLIDILSDEYMMRILYATGKRPISISELSREYDIPITAAYRRVESLKKMEFIEESGFRTSVKNKKVPLFTSLIEKIDLHFHDGEMVFEMFNNRGEISATRKDIMTDLEMECKPPSVKVNIFDDGFYTGWGQ